MWISPKTGDIIRERLGIERGEKRLKRKNDPKQKKKERIINHRYFKTISRSSLTCLRVQAQDKNTEKQVNNVLVRNILLNIVLLTF